ncbi:MAG: GNAT family N-acetyltransferase, partial [Pseudomonadota bacterium]
GALRKMFVNPEYRGKLYNTAGLLLSELLTWARQQGMGEIYLGTTDKFLAAHRFYEKKGFDLIDRKMLPEAFPVMKVDTRFYVITL